MNDTEIDELLASRRQAEDDGLAGFVREVRSTYVQSPSEATARRHLALMMEATRVPDEAPARSRLGWSRAWAKIAVVSVAGLLGTSGLAVAGVLPDRIQSTVADGADQVGISLDNPNEDDGPNNDVDDRPVGKDQREPPAATGASQADEARGAPGARRQGRTERNGAQSTPDGQSQAGQTDQSGRSSNRSDDGQSGTSGPSRGSSGENQSGDSGTANGSGGANQSGDSGD